MGALLLLRLRLRWRVLIAGMTHDDGHRVASSIFGGSVRGHLRGEPVPLPVGGLHRIDCPDEISEEVRSVSDIDIDDDGIGTIGRHPVLLQSPTKEETVVVEVFLSQLNLIVNGFMLLIFFNYIFTG